MYNQRQNLHFIYGKQRYGATSTPLNHDLMLFYDKHDPKFGYTRSMNIRWLVTMLVWLFLLALGSPVPARAAGGASYYVDSVNGSDSNSGTLANSPWRTLAKVQSHHYSPGDTINFKHGSSWTGELFIVDSGVQGNPITFRDYGTGAAPTISKPSTGPGGHVLRIYSSWVVLQGFLVKDSGDAAVQIESGANNVIVQNMEATNAGQGVATYGQYSLITQNYAHDLKMIVNTPTPTSDDYGALGFLVMNSNNEVSYNSCVNCRAPSYDYGYDGGVVEIYANGDNSFFHHNYGKASNGFIEVGGGSARNVRVAYNVSDNNYIGFACLHNAGTFASTLDNFRIENNTVINTTVQGLLQIACLESAVTSSQLLVRNNIFYSNTQIANPGDFTHTNNIYFLLGNAPLGFPLGPNERVSDPRLIDVNIGNYDLQWDSPAIDVGMTLGYSVDFANRLVPQGLAPDIGAFEYPRAIVPVSLPIFLPFIQR